MSKIKNRKKSLFINLIIVMSTAYIIFENVILGTKSEQFGQEFSGLGYLKAFTNLSNLFNGIAALIALIFIIKRFKEKDVLLNDAIYKLQYISCISVFLTFITVVFFLTPTQAKIGVDVIYFYLYDMFHFHLFNPLLTLYLFIFEYNEYKPCFKDNLLVILPTFLYSILYSVMVLSNKWIDFYGFTFGSNYKIIPIVLIVMYIITYLLGYLVRKLKNRIQI